MRLPNFIISGFPKCGTTSLHYYLAEHPEIFMPKQNYMNVEITRILTPLSASNPNAPDANGWTPLHRAARRGIKS